MLTPMGNIRKERKPSLIKFFLIGIILRINEEKIRNLEKIEDECS